MVKRQRIFRQKQDQSFQIYESSPLSICQSQQNASTIILAANNQLNNAIQGAAQLQQTFRISKQNKKAIRKDAKRAQPRRARNNRDESTWTKENKLLYFLFFFQYCYRFSFFSLSWKKWKPENFYLQMSSWMTKMGKTGKDDQQCKSFDERMKSECFNQFQYDSDMDLMPFVLSKLQLYLSQQQGSADCDLVKDCLNKYSGKMSNQSDYMRYLEGSNKEEDDWVHQCLNSTSFLPAL